MRGIITASGYVPYHRLTREAIGAAHGLAAGQGARAVASYDEDTNSMGAEAARLALRSMGDAPDRRATIDQLWFSTTDPSYFDKTNATTIHAALRLDRGTAAFDANGSVRSSAACLRAALEGAGTYLVVSADRRSGLPNSADEREGGDAAAALVIGDDDERSVIAEFLGAASLTEEFLDRWRTPGDLRSKQWEERFGETRYVPLGVDAFNIAIDRAGVSAEDITTVIVSGTHSRAVKQVGVKISAATGSLADDLRSTVGNSGSTHASLLLAKELEGAKPGQIVALVVLADGCDVFVFRTTPAISEHRARRSVAQQIAAGREGLLYTKFLAWNSMVSVQPPNRPEPARVSSSAVVRNEGWKFGFVASQDRESGAIHMPPSRVSYAGGNTDDMIERPMAEIEGTIFSFTVDRLAYSPSPPVVFAVIDFDGGGRLPMELTDVDFDEVAVGDRVEVTFRRLNQSDGIHNYFWKAKPLRHVSDIEGPGR